jgi:PAS domain S-box-containing protein
VTLPAPAAPDGVATQFLPLARAAGDGAGLPLGALVDALPTLLFACTPDGRHAYVNDAWFRYTGLPDAPALQSQWPALVHPDDQERLRHQWERTLTPPAIDELDLQFRLRHAGGEFRWHQSHARLVRGALGQPHMWVGHATEIEQQRRVEDALDRREREFRTLVDNAPDSITRLDRGLRHVYANHALHAAFGIEPADLVGRTALEAGLPPRVGSAWQDGAMKAFLSGEEQECDFTTGRPGAERHFNCRLVPEADGAGRVESVLCIAYDVTHRRQAQLALLDSEQRFRQFAQCSDDVFWFADLACGDLQYLSPAFERLWGRPVAAVLEAPTLWRLGVHAEDQDQLPQPFFASQADGQGHEPVREYRVVRPDGATRWVRDRRFHLQAEDGRVLRIAGIAEDITERKLRDLEREELLARERAARGEAEALASAKDEFLAVVSHELRSPLNAIRGWAHVLRKTLNLPEAQMRPLDAIERNVTAQARMVDDLLDTQRLLRGKVSLDRRMTPLAPLIDQAVEAFRPAATDKQLQVKVYHAPDVPMIEADPDRLRQTLVNLLSNAVKFTPSGGRIEVLSQRVAPDRLRIEVRDSGVGLEASQVQQLFQPFPQASGSSSTRRQGGLGLGLALARQLVELHGGRLAVHSEGVDHGSTFTIELPAPPRDSSVPAPGASTAPATRLSLRGRRIAVAEDDPEGRQILELLLRDEGADAVFFPNAAEAYHFFSHVPATHRPEVLISDIAMPGEDGYSLIRRLRELHRERGEPALPAVALTAFSSASDRAKALAAGFDAHLGKPMEPELLRSTLKELLQARTEPAAICPS